MSIAYICDPVIHNNSLTTVDVFIAVDTVQLVDTKLLLLVGSIDPGLLLLTL